MWTLDRPRVALHVHRVVLDPRSRPRLRAGATPPSAPRSPSAMSVRRGVGRTDSGQVCGLGLCAHHCQFSTSPVCPSMAMIRHQPWPMYVPSATTVWRTASGQGDARADAPAPCDSFAPGAGVARGVRRPFGMTAPAAGKELLQRPLPPAPPPWGSSSSTGRPGISTAGRPCRSARSSSSHARTGASLRFAGWRSHAIQPTTGGASLCGGCREAFSSIRAWPGFRSRPSSFCGCLWQTCSRAGDSKNLEIMRNTPKFA